MEKRANILCAVTLLSASLLGCTGSTEPITADVTSFQLPGCVSQLRLHATSDSCFTYDFQTALVVDFCANGNCCPDSARFSFAHRITSDSVIVTIVDTAANLCHCTCRYLLHTEYPFLPADRYLYVCRQQYDTAHVILYSEWVTRN